jgi:hypothetical protein
LLILNHTRNFATDGMFNGIPISQLRTDRL